MKKQQLAIQLRTRKLAVLMYDARLANRRSPEEVAAAMGIPVDLYQSYEKGERAPSLPELETLAFYLDIPLEHFWSSESLVEKKPAETIHQKERLRQLRDRIIGASLRKARTNLNFSYAEVSSVTGISEERMRKFENGEESLTLPELEVLCRTLDTRVEEFFDQRGPIGKWRAQHIAIQKFLELPPELQEFVCKPVNRPYIDLAIRLSNLNVDRLRGIAEGLLEITY